MKEYRHGAHTVFEIHLHVVWTTKYRRPALTKDTMAEGEEFVQDAGRVSAFAEAVLGTPHVGTRVFLL